MCRQIPLDFACGCPGTCNCGDITLAETKPCDHKLNSQPCHLTIVARKAVSMMPCAKCYVPGPGVPEPGPIFRYHIDCQPRPNPNKDTEPVPVSPTKATLPSVPSRNPAVQTGRTPRGILPSFTDRFPAGQPIHPGLLGMAAYDQRMKALGAKKANDDKAFTKRHLQGGQEHQGPSAPGAITGVDPNSRVAPFNPTLRMPPPRPAQQPPVRSGAPGEWPPRPKTWATVARAVPAKHTTHANQTNSQTTPPPPPGYAPLEWKREQSPSEWTLSNRTLWPRVASWVDRNATLHSAAHEAEVLAEAEEQWLELEGTLMTLRLEEREIKGANARLGRRGVFEGEDANWFRFLPRNERGEVEVSGRVFFVGGNRSWGWGGDGGFEGESASGLRVVRGSADGRGDGEADEREFEGENASLLRMLRRNESRDGDGIEEGGLGERVSQRGDLSGNGRGTVGARSNARGGRGGARGGRGNGRGGRGRGNVRGGRGRGGRGAPANPQGAA